MNQEYIIGFDLGGTKIAGAIADMEGSILYKTTVKTMAAEGYEAVVKRIEDVVKSLMEYKNAKSHDIAAIGIGSPGALNSKNGIIISAANLPGFDNLPITKILEDRSR
jgi:glucokinase